MTTLPTGPADFKAPNELSLVVTWKKGKGIEGGEVTIAGDVETHLLDACDATVTTIGEKERREYSPDMQLEDEEYLVAELAKGDDDDVDPVLDLLFSDQPLPTVRSRDLPSRPLLFYAVVFETDDGPLAFVRKTNPRPGTKAGRIAGLLGDSLTKVTKQVFFLDPSFDLVVSEHEVLGLNQRTFEMLFRDLEALQARIPGWVEDVAEHLPIAGDGVQRLAERCASDSRLRRRLRSIVERGHLAQISIEQVRAHILELEVDEDEFIEGDELVLDDQDPFKLLYLLNEDLFQGGLTNEAFVSDRKSPRA